MIFSMINLPNVTLVAIGSENIEGMVKALEYSSRGIQWGEIKIISNHCPRFVNVQRKAIQYEYISEIKSIECMRVGSNYSVKFILANCLLSLDNNLDFAEKLFLECKEFCKTKGYCVKK